MSFYSKGRSATPPIDHCGDPERSRYSQCGPLYSRRRRSDLWAKATPSKGGVVSEIVAIKAFGRESYPVTDALAFNGVVSIRTVRWGFTRRVHCNSD